MSTSAQAFLNRAGAAQPSACTALALVLLVASPAAAQQPQAPSSPLRPGDLVVVNHQYLVDGNGGKLVKVDPSTRAETILSDFADPSQGPIATPRPGLPPHFFASLVVGDAAAVFVNHSSFEGALQVDPATGGRTIIGDFPVAAVEPSGDLLSSSGSRLVRVNRSTGTTTTITDFHDPAQGPVSDTVGHVAIEASGQIIVASFDANRESPKLFRVEPTNGVRTLLSDFGEPAQGPTLSGLFSPFRLVVDHSGDILVVVRHLLSFPNVGDLFRVDAVTGARTRRRFCDFGSGGGLKSVALDETGDLLYVTGGDEFVPPVLHRFDATTGACGGVRAWTETVGVVPTPLVNDTVSLSVASTAFEPGDEPYAPAGVFRIAATFTNVSPVPLRNPFFRVAELSGGNMLVSGDRPPDLIREGGRGTRQTPDVGSDGVLLPGESVGVEFRIGLQPRGPFTFFVNVFGELAPASDPE
jgi:hypothetical protein